MKDLDFRWDITSEEVYAEAEARDYYADAYDMRDDRSEEGECK